MRALVLLYAAAAASAASAEPTRAEFAFKWKLGSAGPQSLRAAAAVLGKNEPKKKEQKDLVVTFFKFEQPAGLPQGSTVILRERRDGGDFETTYKLRGSETARADIDARACGLSKPADKTKREFDVVYSAPETSTRSYSFSCEIEKKADSLLPSDLKPVRPRHTSKMQRWKFKEDETTIERWELPNGDRYIEVSRSGDDRPEDADRFVAEVVKPLVKAGAIGSTQSMTALASQGP